MDTTDGHGLRCGCARCLEHRATIRVRALAELTAPDGVEDGDHWAERSWDGPLARFPGSGWSDGGHPGT